MSMSGPAFGSDHCPAMKGIETVPFHDVPEALQQRSDHCPAMKGIETCAAPFDGRRPCDEATTAPQ